MVSGGIGAVVGGILLTGVVVIIQIRKLLTDDSTKQLATDEPGVGKNIENGKENVERIGTVMDFSFWKIVIFTSAISAFGNFRYKNTRYIFLLLIGFLVLQLDHWQLVSTIVLSLCLSTGSIAGNTCT